MTSFPATIYGDKKLIITRDGSFSFYSIGYGESYKTKSVGAYSESRHKFAEAGGVRGKFCNGDVRILDICFGIGMNLAVTIEEYLRSGSSYRLHIVSVEKDPTLINIVKQAGFLFPFEGYRILRELLEKGRYGNITLELYILDALGFIEFLSGKFHAIYFDPFSEKHNPEMWNRQVFIKMGAMLEQGGRLMTYASNAPLRGMLGELGFRVTKIASAGGRNHPSIMCEMC